MAEFPVTKPQLVVPSCVNLSTYVQGMSDYEVRCYYTQLVQQWAEEWAQMQTEWGTQQQAFEDFKKYVNNKIAEFQDWFDNLDVQNEINNKIDEMASSGELLNIIKSTVTNETQSATDSWLASNMTPGAGAPALDSSLTLSNAAAQSKAVGDRFKKVPTSLDNIIMTTLEASGIANRPNGYTLGTVITYSGYPGGATNPNDGCVQIATNNFGDAWIRLKWADSWTEWKAMFETIAVIGDSYASGEIVRSSDRGDYYNLSWIQNIARMCGVEGYNYSMGGLSTRTWLTNAAHGLSKLLSDPPRNLYIMALGINDCDDLGAGYIGTVSDLHEDYNENPDTFYGNYGKIVGNVKNHAPNSKIIFLSLASLEDTDTGILYDAAIRAIANHYSVPFINLNDDAFFRSNFYNNNRPSGHPISVTYSGMATAIMRLFSKCATDYALYFYDYIG